MVEFPVCPNRMIAQAFLEKRFGIRKNQPYLHVCVMQVRSVLRAAGVLNRCQFYWDQNSLCKANLAQYHASRALALTYDFNNKECDTYEADIKTEPTGVLRRQRMRGLLHGHLQRKARELGIEDWEQSVLDFPDLVQTDKASDAAFSLIVCNPGIEACTYIHKVEVQTVFAYGMFVGDPPISPGPCGTRVRSVYTRTFVDLIRDKKTPMFLLPMELFSDATWELDGKDVHDICGKNAPLEAHISQYKRDYRGPDECILPGLLAAALIVNPGLCFQKQVRFEVQKNAEGAEVIVFEGDEEGNITLYFPDA